MKLTATEIKASKPKDKAYKLSDGGGMYLEIFPNGTKSWRLKYRIGGKEKRVVFGVYPTVSLAEARTKRDEAKRILAAGGDPGQEKQAEKQAKVMAVANSFERLALEWHEHKSPKEGANKQVISSQADSLIKISRIWADFFPANTSNQPI